MVIREERKNSETSGSRTRQPLRLFCARQFHASGGRQRYNTRKGKPARRLVSVLTLPAPLGPPRKNGSRGISTSTRSCHIMATQPLVVRASMPTVTDCLIGSTTVPSVDARSLHASLGCRKDFNQWMRDQIVRVRLVEERDYLSYLEVEKPLKGRPRREYALSLDAAKHISMMAGTDRGWEVRQYFIECERQVLATAAAHPQQPAIPQTLPEALRLAADLAEKNDALQARVKEDEPKVLFHDAVTQASNTQTMQEAAKVLGTGPNRLFAYLREARVLTLQNVPYQHYLDKGYFRVVQHEFFDHRTKRVHIQARTLVTGKGMTFLQRFVQSGKANPVTSCNAA